MPDELLVEGKSRLSVLVIEDSPEFGKNALAALKAHDVKLATTLKEAQGMLASGARFDFILSDAHVPLEAGKEPVAIVSEMLRVCYASDIPMCFVTKADHHGLIDRADEGYVSLRVVTLDEAAKAFMELSRKEGEVSEKRAFSAIASEAARSVKSDSKTPDLWAKALEMARNAATKCPPIAGAIRQVRGVGLDVVMEKGLPRVVPGRNLKV